MLPSGSALPVVYNLGLLLYFKYANFFIDNTNALLTQMGVDKIAWTSVALPLGISFFTFQQLSYLVGRVPWRETAAQKSDRLHLAGWHVSPNLVAGPILRYRDMADQMRDRSANENISYRLSGMIRFAIGLGRKVLIADTIGIQVHKIFMLPHAQLDFLLCWIGAIGFALIVYHDFAGYSDMAIGLARMMGFRFPENFSIPFTSTSITEFWQRWHITLGAWMRNYLYIPLGGNRSGKPWRTYRNLLIVFLASGLWHGAAWDICGLWAVAWPLDCLGTAVFEALLGQAATAAGRNMDLWVVCDRLCVFHCEGHGDGDDLSQGNGLLSDRKDALGGFAFGLGE